MIGRLWLLACGQVRVRVTGASLTRFLNLCAAQGITLRQMDRTAWNELHATLSIRDFRTLRRHMGRTGCRVHILRKRGLPFLAARLRPRTALWGGAVFAAALCWLLGTHVWAIQTEIAPAIDETAVMQQLSEMGVRIGMPIKKLNTRQIRWKMMQLQPNITFFSLNLRGNSLTVVAYGSTDPPEVLDEHAITKVVAARDGVVTQVRALEGQPMVRAGDAVQTGDTLISGLVEPTREGGKYRTAHARGTVQAYTTHTVQAARPLTEQSKRYTGKIRHQYALVMGNKRLNFYIGSVIAGGTCDKIVTTRHFWLSDSVVLPVALLSGVLTFTQLMPANFSAPTAALLPQFRHILCSLLPVSVVLAFSLPETRLSASVSRGLSAGGALLALLLLRTVLLLGANTAALLPYPAFTAAGLAAIGNFARHGEVFFAVPLLLCEIGRCAALVCVLLYPFTRTCGVLHLRRPQ